MFNTDFFQEAPQHGPSRAGSAIGYAGLWLLHIAKVAFLIYSGYHGINATASYRGSGELATFAGIVGIVVVEIVLLAIYLAWHNQRITGTAQSLAAAATYVIGFTLACLGIVADSQINAGHATQAAALAAMQAAIADGMDAATAAATFPAATAVLTLSPFLSAYIRWLLPIAPAVMALGAMLTHELDPHQLNARKQASDELEFAKDQFNAYMAARKAEMHSAKMLANMQLNAKASAAQQIAAWYNSEEAQRAIAARAMQDAPALLRAIGVDVAAVDGDGNGRVDAGELAAWAERNPAQAGELLNRIGQQPHPTQRHPQQPGNGRIDFSDFSLVDLAEMPNGGHTNGANGANFPQRGMGD